MKTGFSLCTEKEQQRSFENSLQRSETFIVSRPFSPLPTTEGLTHSSTTRTMIPETTLPLIRPSKLPSRHSTYSSSTNTTAQPSTYRRSSSTQKESKLPIRTTNVLPKQSTPPQKLNAPAMVFTKNKKDFPVATNRSSAKTSSAATTRLIPIASIVPSRPVSTVNYRVASASLNTKRAALTIESVSLAEKSNNYLGQTNSTSSDSSMEEQPQQQADSRLASQQDEGYSTWSSTDVKDDVMIPNVKPQETTEKSQAIGLVRDWLDTSDRQCLERSTKEGRLLEGVSTSV